MWAEKGGLDFEGRARWDAWTAVKVRRQAGRGLGGGGRLEQPVLGGDRGQAATPPPGSAGPSAAPFVPCPAMPRLCRSNSRSRQQSFRVPNLVQGMAGDKAKLEFVRTYYEFLPKSLYTDTRP